MTRSAPAGSGAHAPTRIAALDGVRGLAILLVIVWHYFTIPVLESKWHLFARPFSLTWAGVDLFFVLSGFLIGGILIRNREAENYFATFYIRRAARLLPMYFVIVGLYALLRAPLLESGSAAGEWLAYGNHGRESMPFWPYLLYLQNFYMAQINTWGAHGISMTWSLAVEEQFYLLAPLLLWLLPPKRVPLALLIGIATAPIFRILAIQEYGNPIAPYVLLPCRWDSLCLGMLGAYFVQTRDGDAWLRANQDVLLKGLRLFGIALIIFLAFNWRMETPQMLTFGFSVLALGCLNVVLVALYVDRPWVRTIFCHPMLTRLGLISYGVYMLHMAVLGGTFMLFGLSVTRDALSIPGFLATLLATAGTIGLAAASWRWFEKPILARGQAVGYRRSAPAGASGARV